MQVGDVHVHTDIPSGIGGHEGRTHAWHKRTFQELAAKASQRELDEEELKQLLHSKGELEKAAERRKAELLEKRKARTLTTEEAEELQPILDREAAERHARQQAEVDRRKAEEAELRAKARAEEEARQREAAAEKRKELLRSKQRVGTLTPDERDELQDMLDRDAAQRAAQPAAAAAAAASAGDEMEVVHDSLDYVLGSLHTPEQKFKVVCDILGVKTDGFSLDELMVTHPALQDKGILRNAIHTADNFMADSANFVGDKYQDFKTAHPEAAAVVEWFATKGMTVLYAASLCTPGGRIAAGIVGLSDLTGLTGYAKENLTTWLKSAGFERSAEGISALTIGMLQSKGGKKIGANSKLLNDLVGKVKHEVVEKFKHIRYVVPRDFKFPELLTVGKFKGPEFPTLKEHFGKHGLTMETYYGNTLKNIRECWTGKGLKVNFRHDGVDKLAHIKRTGTDSFTLTVTTHTLTRIYTHFEGAKEIYLLRKGITLPKGF
ncbi:cell envelope integrity protein TolA [Candidatus Bodocaedibacter vickermanii]|uniref:Uncharacterized protein n=1 Tax=Candidatus Bodocaedibacter vickermanii TaxID=2741701 RepID=A0A7L9RUA1_9PROT|nr:hypothetical protein CPBP_00968 [Candidatus Paracaedibacteraceae bacterium 'Lake Konstanz']